jgi:hypothetical protein
MIATKRLGVLCSLALILVFSTNGFAQFKLDQIKFYIVERAPADTELPCWASSTAVSFSTAVSLRKPFWSCPILGTPTFKNREVIEDRNSHFTVYQT